MSKPMRSDILILATALGIGVGDAESEAGKPRIKLLSAGKGQRQVLRYMLKPGARSVMVLETDMTSKTALPGMKPMEIKLPTMVMEMRLDIGQQLPRGELRYSFELTAAHARKRKGVPNYLLGPMNQALSQTKGVRGGAIIDERGFNRDTRINVPATAPAQVKQTMAGMQQSMESLSSPLPARPVGIGARWELHQTVNNQGMKLQQVTRFRIVRLWPHKVELEAVVRQTARPQTINLPTGTAQLKRYRAKGAGTVIIDLRGVIPKSRMRVQSDYELSVTVGGSQQNVKASIDLEMRIHPK